MARDPFEAPSRWELDDLKRRLTRIEEERFEERMHRYRVRDRWLMTVLYLSYAALIGMTIAAAATS